MTPIKTSKKVNEKEVLLNIQDPEFRQKPKIELGQFVGTADITRVFSKGDNSNWSYFLHTTTEVIHDIIPSYRINCLPLRYIQNENLLLPTKLSLDQKNKVMKELSLIQYYNK